MSAPQRENRAEARWQAKPPAPPATRTLLCWACSFAVVFGQQMSIAPIRSTTPIVRWYEAPQVPPIRLANSPRLRELIRAGALYLTVQDAIALALENSIDLEVARYNPLIAASQLERFRAGGALPGVPSNASQAGSVAAGQGVAGSQAAAGVSGAGTSGGGNRSVNATISQVGPVVQNLDPIFQDASTFSHVSTPQSNTTQSGTTVLVSNTRVYNTTLQQGLITGGQVTLNYTEHYLRENALSDFLNPSTAPSLSLSFQHNFLNGFGIAVNSRNIRVAQIGLSTSDLNFRTQVIAIVAQVLNVYYTLAANYENVKSMQSALEVSRTLARDTARQIEIGTLAPLDQTTADAQVAAGERDLIDAEAAVQQQELQLKSMISREGAADPVLRSVRIVPVDTIAVPAADDLAPTEDLVREALAKRPDLAAERANLTSSEISAIGTRNGLLPTLAAIGGETHAGLSGVPQEVIQNGRVVRPDPYFVGGIGDALGQVFRRDFPSDRIGGFIGGALRNRQAQADFGIDQLSLRQTQLVTARDLNQVQVQVRNYVVAMRQARSRYETARKNVELNQQLFRAEKEKQSLGTSTPFNVIQSERDVTAAQAAMLSAEVTWNNARIALDQALGRTLENNHVSIDEARAARIAKR